MMAHIESISLHYITLESVSEFISCHAAWVCPLTLTTELATGELAYTLAL